MMMQQYAHIHKENQMYSKFIFSFLSVLAVASLPLHAQVALDDDNASRAVYDDGIQNFDNGSTTGAGTGFGGWVFGGSASSTNFNIASQSTLGGSSTAIDVSNESFRLTDVGNTGNFIDAFRFFDGGDLGIGQTFSFDIATNFRDGYKGFRLRDTDDSTNIFQFEVSTDIDGGGTDGYAISNAATGNQTFSAYDPNTIFSFAFTQTGALTGDWDITRSGGISANYSGTYSGQISSFQMYTFLAGTAAESALIFNNFSVVPEPGSLTLLLGGLGLLAYFRKRKQS
jgi:hypothetical protein